MKLSGRDSEHLIRFLEGLSGAVQLYNRSVQNGSFIEAACLCASIIDASLRIGVILKHQLDTESNELFTDMLYQGASDKPLSEKCIYDRALKNGVIDQGLHDTLYRLYDDRNRVIHRYIISEITTNEVLMIVQSYEDVRKRVAAQVNDLEQLQTQRGVGMTVRNTGQKQAASVTQMADAKHGNSTLAEKLKSND